MEKIFKAKGEKRKSELETQIIEARNRDAETYKTWRKVLICKENFIWRCRCYYEAITTIQSFEDLVEFGSGFEFGTDIPERNRK